MKRRYDNVVTIDDTLSSEIIWYQRWWHWFIVAGRTCTTSCSLGRSQLVPAPPLPLPNTLPHLSSSQHYSLSAEDFSGSQAIGDFSWHWRHWPIANVLLDWFTYCNKSADCISKQEAGVPSDPKVGYNRRSLWFSRNRLRGGQEF